MVQAIQLGVPLARVEILDDMQMRAVNAWSKLDYPEKTTLFFEFHGSERYVAGTGRDGVGTGGRQRRRRVPAGPTCPRSAPRLWKARHEAYYAAVGLRKGCVGWATDVCVPISRLAECILETKKDLEARLDPRADPGPRRGRQFPRRLRRRSRTSPRRLAEAEALNQRLVRRALDMDGTCTGEHGIGLGKQDWLVEELGDAVDMMRTIKRALDPKNLFNPGKIFSL